MFYLWKFSIFFSYLGAIRFGGSDFMPDIYAYLAVCASSRLQSFVANLFDMLVRIRGAPILIYLTTVAKSFSQSSSLSGFISEYYYVLCKQIISMLIRNKKKFSAFSVKFDAHLGGNSVKSHCIAKDMLHLIYSFI